MSQESLQTTAHLYDIQDFIDDAEKIHQPQEGQPRRTGDRLVRNPVVVKRKSATKNADRLTPNLGRREGNIAASFRRPPRGGGVAICAFFSIKSRRIAFDRTFRSG